jgi:hypothetical protein
MERGETHRLGAVRDADPLRERRLEGTYTLYYTECK